jgi:hypothetical protein
VVRTASEAPTRLGSPASRACHANEGIQRRGASGKGALIVGAVELAGVGLPDSASAQAAERLCRAASQRVFYAHAVRSYLFAALLARHDGMRVDQEVLFVGCVLHDIGLTNAYEHPARPFEYVSADVAVDLTVPFGWSLARQDLLHRAIVLHMASEVDASESPEVRARGRGRA